MNGDGAFRRKSLYGSVIENTYSATDVAVDLLSVVRSRLK